MDHLAILKKKGKLLQTILLNKKLDRSSQGFLDKDILPLLERINTKYTTSSSCSGRITLMKGTKKGEAQWLYKTHTKASAKKIHTILKQEQVLRFLYEPLIIHLQCKNKQEAEKLVHILQSNGFKKSYILSIKNWTLEINDTGRMETILIKDLPFAYISLLVKEANTRLQKTKENIKKLEQLFASV